MLDHDSQGAKVLLCATSPSGDELALIEYVDGACGITRNGEPLPAWLWNPCQMTEATKALLSLAGLP